MAHFEIKDLSFSYALGSGKKALDHINLEIEQGEYITVCGKSGSGKTTLLKHLKSVLTPHGTTEGDIYFEGKLLRDISHRDQSAKIGYVMQNPDNQIVTDKVWHELAFGLESLGMDQKTIRLRVAEMASYFGIQGWFHKNVSELSGGQKQLLNLASIMAMQPSVLILDEPTSQLDPIAATDFLNTVRKINLELGTTIIITEHRLEDVFHASDRVVVMEKGHVLTCDEPHKVGEYLKTTGNQMFAAMPSPVQIYYGVDNNLKCPLTVREGRNWLNEVFAGKDIKHAAIEEKDRREEDTGVPAISVKEAWFRYEKTGTDILKGVNFYVSKGEFFAIVGGNGTGLPIGSVMLALNVPLFLVSMKSLGLRFGVRSLIATLLFSLMLDTIHVPQMVDDKWLATVYGGLTSGLGFGLILRGSATTGGSDMLASVIHRFCPRIRVSIGIFAVDASVIVASAFVYDAMAAMYALICVLICNVVVDFVLEGPNTSHSFFIISDKSDEIATRILKELDRGVTALEGTGMYSNTKKRVLFCVVNRMESVPLRRIIFSVDPRAFVVTNKAHDTYGEGFKVHAGH